MGIFSNNHILFMILFVLWTLLISVIDLVTYFLEVFFIE